MELPHSSFLVPSLVNKCVTLNIMTSKGVRKQADKLIGAKLHESYQPPTLQPAKLAVTWVTESHTTVMVPPTLNTVLVSLTVAPNPLCVGPAHSCMLLMGYLADVCGFAYRMLHLISWRGCWAEQLRDELTLTFSQHHYCLLLYQLFLHRGVMVVPSKWPGALEVGKWQMDQYCAYPVEAGTWFGVKWKESLLPAF